MATPGRDAEHRSAEKVALAIYRLPIEPYAPVRRQLLVILREVNQARRAAGFSKIPSEVLVLRRRVVRPFENRNRKKSPPSLARELTATDSNQ